MLLINNVKIMELILFQQKNWPLYCQWMKIKKPYKEIWVKGGGRGWCGAHETATQSEPENRQLSTAGRDSTIFCSHLKFLGVMQTSGPVDGNVTDLKERSTFK